MALVYHAIKVGLTVDQMIRIVIQNATHKIGLHAILIAARQQLQTANPAKSNKKWVVCSVNTPPIHVTER